jgi:hypothetical protein
LSARISSAMASRSASRTVMGLGRAPVLLGLLLGALGLRGGAFALRGAAWRRRRRCPRPAWHRGRLAARRVALETGFCGPPAAFLPSPPSSSAMAEFTARLSVPSSTRILVIVPSSTASTSMVALSVSISAITSPASTASPSFFSHATACPPSWWGRERASKSSHPSQRASTRISVQSSLSSGSGRGLRELGGIGDDGLHLVVDRLEIFASSIAAFQQDLAHAVSISRAARASSALPRACGTSRGRTWSGRGSGRSSSQGCTDHCPRGNARPRAAGGLEDGLHVHAVDLLARDAPGGAVQGEVLEAEARSALVPMPYLLFSMMKTTGSFIRAARL